MKFHKETYMTEAERYEFDLNGYIVYRDLIPPDDVRKMNEIIDADLKQKGKEDTFSFSFLELDPCFLELMAHPRTLRIMRHMIGDWLRLDHAYGLQMDTGTVDRGHIKPNLHGGPRTDNGEHQYQWFNDRMYNGLIVAIYALEDVNPGDGGFICVPGSHKANLHFRPAYDSHLVVNPSLRAGDMLIFTEALVHGTTTWTSPRRRRSLLYKYSPGHSTWASVDHLDTLKAMAQNDLQRDLLRPPCVGGRTPIPFPGEEAL
jgi:hypothetical protein